MAAAANSAHQKRTRPRGPVPADVSGHHRAEAAHRDGRQQGRPLQVRQARQIGHQIEIGPSVSIQLPSAGLERHSCADHHQTIASGSCKPLQCFVCDATSKLKNLRLSIAISIYIVIISRQHYIFIVYRAVSHISYYYIAASIFTKFFYCEILDFFLLPSLDCLFFHRD